MLSERQADVHAGDSKSRPTEQELGAMTIWLASRVSCLSLDKLLYNFCKASRALPIC
jgi:hypothetical protein